MEDTAQDTIEESDMIQVQEPVQNKDPLDMGLGLPEMDMGLGLDF